jgi:hypothetical protein
MKAVIEEQLCFEPLATDHLWVITHRQCSNYLLLEKKDILWVRWILKYKTNKATTVTRQTKGINVVTWDYTI